jgi:hypothetical protein
MSKWRPLLTNEAPCSVWRAFATTTGGYRKLLHWLQSFGTLELVSVEGTGSCGAGLTCDLHHHGISVVEVDQPNRQRRQRKGKSDPKTPSLRSDYVVPLKPM